MIMYFDDNCILLTFKDFKKQRKPKLFFHSRQFYITLKTGLGLNKIIYAIYYFIKDVSFKPFNHHKQYYEPHYS